MENDLEIYRQRYATWRYLDQTRWKLVSFLIALIGSTVALTQAPFFVFNKPIIVCLGCIGIALALSMLSVDKAIRSNSSVLSKFAEKIGDTDIPDLSDNTKSIGFWIAAFLLTISLGLIIFSMIQIAKGT